MTEKELRRLNRHDILELLVEQSRESSRLRLVLEEREERLLNATAGLERLKSKLDEKDRQIEKLKGRLSEKDAAANVLKTRLNQKDETIDKLKERLDRKDEEIARISSLQADALRQAGFPAQVLKALASLTAGT